MSDNGRRVLLPNCMIGPSEPCDAFQRQTDRIAELEAALQAGRDLMAIVHGDGGHYREAHGDRKAADDAIAIVSKLRVDLDAERERREDIGEIGAMSKDGTRIGSLARVGLSMRLTAPARLQTWAHASRMQSDEDTYDLERTVVGSVVAGVTADRCGQCGACDRSMVPLELGNREASDMEMTERNKDAPTQAVGGPFAWLVQSD
jgi:hypothetical protein